VWRTGPQSPDDASAGGGSLLQAASPVAYVASPGAPRPLGHLLALDAREPFSPFAAALAAAAARPLAVLSEVALAAVRTHCTGESGEVSAAASTLAPAQPADRDVLAFGPAVVPEVPALVLVPAAPTSSGNVPDADIGSVDCSGIEASRHGDLSIVSAITATLAPAIDAFNEALPEVSAPAATMGAVAEAEASAATATSHILGVCAGADGSGALDASATGAFTRVLAEAPKCVIAAASVRDGARGWLGRSKYVSYTLQWVDVDTGSVIHSFERRYSEFLALYQSLAAAAGRGQQRGRRMASAVRRFAFPEKVAVAPWRDAVTRARMPALQAFVELLQEASLAEEEAAVARFLERDAAGGWP
jgi:hypothetical protein